METTTGSEKIKATAGYVFGGLAFIPLVGLLFGIIAIIIGIAKKSKGPVILGIAGILFTVALYGSLFYFGFVTKSGPWAGMKVQLTSQIISTTAGQIALYKQKHGKLPSTLDELGPPSSNNLFFTTDPWNKKLRYKPKGSDSFEIRSAGPDGLFDTQDDISASF